MLILKKKKGEEMVFNNDLRIEILSFSKTYVTLGIQAPKNIRILKEKLNKNSALYLAEVGEKGEKNFPLNSLSEVSVKFKKGE